MPSQSPKPVPLRLRLTDPTAVSDDLDRLIREAQRGDHAAFATIVERFQWYVLETARRHSPADAEDVSQRVWVEVHATLSRYDQAKASFSRWIRVITSRRAITASLVRNRREAVRKAMESQVRDTSESESPQLALEAREMAEAARACVQRLSKRKHEVFSLICLKGLSRAEAAGRLGMTEKSVRRTLCEAREDILTCLQRKKLL